MPSQASGNIKAIVGANVFAARKAAGLRQRDLAERLDVDPMLVSKWERAEHKPSATNLEALALEFGHDIAWFYTDHERRAA